MSSADYKHQGPLIFSTQTNLNMHIFLRNSLLPFLALLICLSLVFSLCPNNKTAVIFNFGDDNSDTGGFGAAMGTDGKYPYGRLLPKGTINRRVTDGRLVIDFLCENLGIGYLYPYLDSLGQHNFSNGANFAVLVACALKPNTSEPTPFDLKIQVLQLTRLYNHYDLLRLGTTKHDFFRNALYTIDIGKNDLSNLFASHSLDQVIGMIPSIISEIKAAMLAIYHLGGNKFLVHNTEPLGCLPRELAIRGKLSSSDLDRYGCLKSLNDGAKAFNAKLLALCEILRSQMQNSTIVYVDVYSIKYDLIANSNYYGFKNPLMACCGFGGPPYNYDPDSSKTCWSSGYTACKEGVPYVSWDGVHYTEAANAIVASKILSTNYSSPPLQLDVFCSNV